MCNVSDDTSCTYVRLVRSKQQNGSLWWGMQRNTVSPIATLATDCCNQSAAGAMLGPCQKHTANSHLQSSYGTKHLNVPSRRKA